MSGLVEDGADSDVRALLDVLGDDGRDVATLHRVLLDRGWSDGHVEDVLGRAVRSGWVFEDCRQDLQASPHRL